jgi:hypothetical protein
LNSYMQNQRQGKAIAQPGLMNVVLNDQERAA